MELTGKTKRPSVNGVIKSLTFKEPRVVKSASKLLENLPSPLRNQIGTGEESEDDPSILDVADDQVIWSIAYFFGLWFALIFGGHGGSSK